MCRTLHDKLCDFCSRRATITLVYLEEYYRSCARCNWVMIDYDRYNMPGGNPWPYDRRCYGTLPAALVKKVNNE
jgi:hypothetical protein